MRRSRILSRIRAGRYEGWTRQTGDIVVEDAYDPSGAPHTRWVTLTRDRWRLTTAGGERTAESRRFDRLKDAVEYLSRILES